MIWQKVSEFAIKSGDWTIAKYISQGKPVFGLWFRSKNLGYFGNPEMAKEFAESEQIGG